MLQSNLPQPLNLELSSYKQNFLPQTQLYSPEDSIPSMYRNSVPKSNSPQMNLKSSPQGVMQNNNQSNIAANANNLAFNSWMFNTTQNPPGFTYNTQQTMQCKSDPSKMVPIMTPMCPQFMTQNNGCTAGTSPLNTSPPMNSNGQMPFLFDWSQFLNIADAQNCTPFIVPLTNASNQNNGCANCANCQRKAQQQAQHQYNFAGLPFAPQQPIQDNRNLNVQLQQNHSPPMLWMNNSDPSQNIANSPFGMATSNTMIPQTNNQAPAPVFMYPMVQPTVQSSSSRASSPTAFSSGSSNSAGSDSECLPYKTNVQNNVYYNTQNQQQLQRQMYHQQRTMPIQRSNDDIMNMNMDINNNNANNNKNVCRDRSRSPVFSMQQVNPMNITLNNVERKMRAPQQQMSGRNGRMQRRNVPMVNQQEQPQKGGKRTKKYGYRSKQNKIDEVLAKLKSTFETEGKLVPENHGIRGPTVGRVHCKKWRSLNKIEEACDKALSDPRINTIRVSLPLSMKNKFQKKGFLVYWECETEEQSQHLIEIFKSYDEKDRQGNDVYDEFQKINIALPTAESEVQPQQHN